MLIPFSDIFKKYNMIINGILHIGAHHCEELNAYMSMGISKKNIIWIEGNLDIVKLMKKRDNQLTIINALITDIDNKEYTFNITNNGQSSSIFEFGTHSVNHPEVKFIDRKKVLSKRIDTLYREENIPENFANFLNIDIL